MTAATVTCWPLLAPGVSRCPVPQQSPVRWPRLDMAPRAEAHSALLATPGCREAGRLHACPRARPPSINHLRPSPVVLLLPLLIYGTFSLFRVLIRFLSCMPRRSPRVELVPHLIYGGFCHNSFETSCQQGLCLETVRAEASVRTGAPAVPTPQGIQLLRSPCLTVGKQEPDG